MLTARAAANGKYHRQTGGGKAKVTMAAKQPAVSPDIDFLLHLKVERYQP
jgi:hypothetical protein